MLELCGALLLFAGAFLQRLRQFRASGAFRFACAHPFGGAFLAAGALLFTLRVTLPLLACLLFSRAFAL